jgi:hypothetical protein
MILFYQKQQYHQQTVASRFKMPNTHGVDRIIASTICNESSTKQFLQWQSSMQPVFLKLWAASTNSPTGNTIIMRIIGINRPFCGTAGSNHHQLKMAATNPQMFLAFRI